MKKGGKMNDVGWQIEMLRVWPMSEKEGDVMSGRWLGMRMMLNENDVTALIKDPFEW